MEKYVEATDLEEENAGSGDDETLGDLWQDDAPQTPLQELMLRAEEQGSVILDDLLEAMGQPDDPDFIEALVSELEELGIEVREDVSESEDDAQNAEDDEDDEDSQKVVADISAVPTSDPVGLYFRQMAQEPLLTAEEEIALAKRIELGSEARQVLEQNGNLSGKKRLELEELIQDGQAAREHLARANTRLVVSIAKRYMGHGLPFSDLIQEGNVGLMRAVDKYDHTRGNRFSTYATWWIRQGVTRALAQKTRTIRIPLHMTERIGQMYRTAQILEQQVGRRPTPEEIADEMEIPLESVQEMMDASRHSISLEHPAGDEGDSELGDFIEDEETPRPADVTENHLLRETIEEVLFDLTPRQAHILRLRFGLGSGEPLTLEEVAGKFGLSRERIRQLEKQALRSLRHPRLAHRLREYLS